MTKKTLPKGIYPIPNGYRVKIPKYNIDKAFSTKAYGTDTLALESAKSFLKKAKAKGDSVDLASKYTKTQYTVEFAFSRYLEIQNPSAETKRKAWVNFRKYFGEFQNKKLTSVKASDISTHLASLVDTCTNNILSTLKTLWKHILDAGILDEMITVNYALSLPLPRSKVPEKVRPVITSQTTLQQVIDLLEKSKNKTSSNIFNTDLIIYGLKIMNESGIRPSECYALSRDSFDFDNRIMKIDSRVGSTSSTTNCIVSPKSNCAYRTIPMNDHLIQLAHDLMNYTDEYYLFTRWNGTLTTSTKASSLIKRVCKRNGIDFRCYQLRHTFVKDLVDSDINPRTIMDLMGHASWRQSLDYSRTTEQQKLEAIQNIHNTENSMEKIVEKIMENSHD